MTGGWRGSGAPAAPERRGRREEDEAPAGGAHLDGLADVLPHLVGVAVSSRSDCTAPFTHMRGELGLDLLERESAVLKGSVSMGSRRRPRFSITCRAALERPWQCIT